MQFDDFDLFQGKFFDIEFDYKGDPSGGHLTLCEYESKAFGKLLAVMIFILSLS